MLPFRPLLIRLFLATWASLLVSGCVPEPPNDGTLRRGGWSGHSPSFPKVLTLGIVPQQTPVDIETNWGPLADLLGERLGRTVLVKTASSIPEFERRCAEGRYDLAYMNPYHYVCLLYTSPSPRD